MYLCYTQSIPCKTAMDANHTEEKSYDLPNCNIFCDLEIENFITILKILSYFMVM